MTDMIDRQTAVNAIRLCECDDYKINMGLIIAMNLIEGVPSAEPTQTNTPNALKSLDCISRQAAIDALEKEKPTPFVNKDGSIDPFREGRQNQWYRDGLAILFLPSAERRGRWLIKPHKMMGEAPCCSECGAFEPIKRRFCPNCGADMRGREDDADE